MSPAGSDGDLGDRGGPGGDGGRAESGPVRGRRLGLDVGTARIGVASCDPDLILATPVETIRVTGGRPAWRPELRRVGELVDEYEAVGVVIGLPTSLRGTDTDSTRMARSFADALVAARPELPVDLTDERLTTVTATAQLHGAGRSSRSHRSVVDQAAAVVLLQAWIDSRRARG